MRYRLRSSLFSKWILRVCPIVHWVQDSSIAFTDARWVEEARFPLVLRNSRYSLPICLGSRWISLHWASILSNRRAIRTQRGCRSWGWSVRLRMPRIPTKEPPTPLPSLTYPSPMGLSKWASYQTIFVYSTSPEANWVSWKLWFVRPRSRKYFWAEYHQVFPPQIEPDCGLQLRQRVGTRCPLLRIWSWFPYGGRFPRGGGRDSYRNWPRSRGWYGEGACIAAQSCPLERLRFRQEQIGRDRTLVLLLYCCLPSVVVLLIDRLRSLQQLRPILGDDLRFRKSRVVYLYSELFRLLTLFVTHQSIPNKFE